MALWIKKRLAARVLNCDMPDLPTRSAPCLLIALVLFGPVAWLAELLIEKTHHRPLGAATFASCAVLLWVVCALITNLVAQERELRPKKAQNVEYVLSGSGLLASGIMLVRTLL